MTVLVLPGERLQPPVEQWPDTDQKAFQAALRAAQGPFRQPRHIRSPASLRIAIKSYGRYLRYLSDTGDLWSHEQPHQRVTRERLAGYFRHLEALGRAGETIRTYFSGLRSALLLIDPTQDVSWILKPDGVLLQRYLVMTRVRPVVPIDSGVLLAWSEEMFAAGIVMPHDKQRCLTVRNAVILGILAERAPRLRTLASLQIGDSLIRTETGWVLREHAEMMKMAVAHSMPLSDRVSRMLDRYADVERREMVAHSPALTAAWVRFGGPLGMDQVAGLVGDCCKRRFGERHGPHFFRHCLATTLADRLPGNPLDGPTLLAHAPATTLKSYNHASKVACAERLQALLERLRPPFESRLPRLEG